MDRHELLALFDREQRREIRFPGMLREATPDVVRMWPSNPTAGEGIVVYSDLTSDNANIFISRQIAFFERLGFDFEWKTYAHDTPADLPDRLLRFGFEAEEAESVVVLDLAESQHVPRKAPVAKIRRIDDPSDLSDIVTVLTQVWGKGQAELGQALGDEMREAPDLIRVYVADVNGVPASVAWIRFHPGSQFASLWGGSTMPEHRGRGLYTALLHTRADEARTRGYRFLTVDASPMSRPILEKLGFQLLTVTQPLKWRRKTFQTSIR